MPVQRAMIMPMIKNVVQISFKCLISHYIY